MTRARSWSALLIAAIVAAVPTAIAPRAPHAQTTPGPYTVLDLGTLGAASTQPSDINNPGQVVGYSATGTSGTRDPLSQTNPVLSITPTI